MQRKISAVIFDLDGTLLDTLDDITAAVNYVMLTYSWQTHSREQIRSFIGNGIRSLIMRAAPPKIESTVFEEAFSLFKSYYTDNCAVFTKPYPGIIELLTKLKERGIRVAVVSNKNNEAVRLLCENYFGSLVDKSFGNTSGIKTKPDPFLTNRAISALCADRDATIYVGDSEVDAQTAENALIRCALVSWGFRNRRTLEGCRSDTIVDSPPELLSFILGI